MFLCNLLKPDVGSYTNKIHALQRLRRWKKTSLGPSAGETIMSKLLDIEVLAGLLLLGLMGVYFPPLVFIGWCIFSGIYTLSIRKHS